MAAPRHPVGLRPGGRRTHGLLAVELEVHLLVEEADHVAHRLGIAARLSVGPGEVRPGTVADPHRPVRRAPLVGAGGTQVGRLEPGPDVLPGEVPAWRERRLEDHHRALALGEDLAVHADSHAARARHGVHPMVRITGVCQRLHVLLEPAVHAPPVERDVGPQVRRQAALRLVRPPCVLDHPVADGKVDVVRGPLSLRALRPAVRRQQVGPDALPRKVVARKLAMFEEQHGRPAVDDDLVADDAADPARRRFEVEPALARQRSVRDSPGLVAERRGSHRQ